MSSTDSTSVRYHLRKFVESTSLRGVSRIFKSSNRVLRILWAFAVAFCTAMLVFQLVRVISQYLRYEFSTVTKEDIWSHTVSQCCNKSHFVALSGRLSVRRRKIIRNWQFWGPRVSRERNAKLFRSNFKCGSLPNSDLRVNVDNAKTFRGLVKTC